MFLVPILVGVVSAVVLLLAASTVGMHRDRGFYAALLIAIAFFYPVFSAERLAFDEAALHGAVGALFLMAALYGYRSGSGAILFAAFTAHAVFDSVGFVMDFHAPMFWAELCIGFDIVLAVAARTFLRRS
ncbi:hypothetical protein [Parvularcula lutaonensis]|uniref:Uncharacterized protein n=1 Tax=Parvularcula lutaonensis TaxID=491923 RepID=A0ABV7ME55_9PROT|nr:hypothetical protein [Parvularcula lutaonensis]GGY54640.1 hypothetical protein GCM10007148_25410 [Parvularcula lutaonensis]